MIKTEEKELEKTKVVDDLNQDTLSALKAKLSKKEDGNMTAKIVAPKKRSINLGVVGTGQGGSRLAEAFYGLGYNAVVLNTAQQDLEHIKVPEENKLLLQFGLGGAAKELEIGREAAETYRDRIHVLVQEKLEDAQAFVLCLSLGGGSGAGSCETVVDVLASVGKPMVVISVLPMTNDDAQTKHNALETLSRLAKLVQSKKIQSMVVVDNAKIETIYSDVSQLEFFSVANKAIIEPIEQFNILSAQSSPSKALDSTEWAKLLIDGEGLSVFGSLTVDNYQDETAIAEAVVSNLDHNLLAGGFDLKQSKYAGFIVAANKEVWNKIPSAAVNYARALIQEHAGTPKALFHGIYVTEDQEDSVKIYSCFTGLSLPMSRVDTLKKEAMELMNQAKSKDTTRSLNLTLETGANETVSAAQKVKDKIASKSSAFGKFMGSVVDKRK